MPSATVEQTVGEMGASAMRATAATTAAANTFARAAPSAATAAAAFAASPAGTTALTDVSMGGCGRRWGGPIRLACALGGAGPE